MPLHHEPIALLSDNYAHLIVDRSTESAVVVDPSEAEPILERLRNESLSLTAIWTTHHHWDHVGGNEVLKRETGCEIYASHNDQGRVPGQTKALGNGDTLTFGGLTARAMLTPGHTLGAVTYVFDGRAFTGDTLFLAGCGRLFEGTPELMWNSLRRLRDLPGETLICCGHEYTFQNLRFAAHLEPKNPIILTRLTHARKARKAGKPTVPADLNVELATNPFLRADDEMLLESLQENHGIRTTPGREAFAALRKMKDGFK